MMELVGGQRPTSKMPLQKETKRNRNAAAGQVQHRNYVKLHIQQICTGGFGLGNWGQVLGRFYGFYGVLSGCYGFYQCFMGHSDVSKPKIKHKIEP